MNAKIYGFLIVLFYTSVVTSQIDFRLKAKSEGFLSTSEEDQLPFWMYKNSRGRVSRNSSLVGTISANFLYKRDQDFTFEAGTTGSYDNAAIADNDLWFDEYFMTLTYRKFELMLGRKQRESKFHELSASNENFAWSLNARPMPGIRLNMTEPLYLNSSNTLGIQFDYEEYFMEEDRYVSNAKVHHKNFFIVYKTENWRLKGGIDHFVQYGGVSASDGSAPSGLENYIKVVLGRGGDETAIGGEQQNALGNHLGTYILDYLYTTSKGVNYNFVYNHFFEDGSGTSFSNFPDGSYSFFIEDTGNNHFWTGLLAEIYYTKNRSRNYDGPENVEQYFNNFLFYKSGWSYRQRILGVPFFDFDANAPSGSVINDEFIAYNLGMNGKLRPKSTGNPYPFKIRFTGVQYYNQTRITEKTLSKVFYSNLDIGVLQNPFQIDLSLGTEFSEGHAPIFASGLRVSKSFF